MTLEEFITKWNGKGLDFDGYYGFQCMDLAHQYAVDVVGHDIPAVAGAKDEWDQTIDGYDKIPNSPAGVPQKGDIIIWGTGVGAFGHIAVFISGDANSFISYDQNWPLGSVCHQQQHNYNGVLGWFHPKALPVSDQVSLDKTTFEKLVEKSTKYDLFVSAGYPSVDSVNQKIDAFQKDNDDKHNQIIDLESTVTSLNAQIDLLKAQIGNSSNQQLKDQIKPLVFSGWLKYLRSRSAIQGLVNV